MKLIRVATMLAACLVLADVPALSAKDSVRVVFNSKIDPAKLHLRDKAASDWMTEKEIKAKNDAKRAEKQQIIYFEYNGARGKWRAIYTDKVMLNGYSWWCFYGQNEMEAKVNSQMATGLVPAFIARSGNAYAMLFVKPEQLADARKVLDELGVGEPKLKK